MIASAVLVLLAGEPAFVPGELIVAFKKDSEPAVIVAKEGRLEPYLAALSERIGVPLRLKRVASGGDVLLAVDFEALASRLPSRLRADPRVRSAEAVADSEVRVEFPEGSAEAKKLAQGKEADLTPALARTCEVPLKGRITSKRELLLAVDAAAVTLDVVKRLKELPEVEYAQPNAVVRALGRAP